MVNLQKNADLCCCGRLMSPSCEMSGDDVGEGARGDEVKKRKGARKTRLLKKKVRLGVIFTKTVSAMVPKKRARRKK